VETKKRSKSKDRKKERYREKMRDAEGADEPSADSGKEVATERVKKKRSKSKDRKKERYREKTKAAKEMEESTTDARIEVAAKEEQPERTKENLDNMSIVEERPEAKVAYPKRMSCPGVTIKPLIRSDSGKKISVQSAVKYWEAQRVEGSDPRERRMSA